MRRLWLKLMRRRRMQQDLETELEFHRAMAAGAGNPLPVGRIREESYDQWRFVFMENLWRDVVHAVRVLRKSPSLVATAVLSLALGVGANTALFSAINGLLFYTVPVPHPENLVRLRWTGVNDMVTGQSSYGSGRDEGISTTLSYPIYQDLRKSNRTLSDLIAFAPEGRPLNVVAGGHAEITTGVLVSGNYYQVLDVKAALGRTIMPDDDNLSASPVAVISTNYWRGHFGADPQVLGQTLTVNNLGVLIVGVMPSEFKGVQQVGDDAPDITLPMSVDTRIGGRERLRTGTEWWLEVMGRLQPGVAPQQVQGNLDGVFQQSAYDQWHSYLGALTSQQRSLARNQNRTHVPHLVVDSGSRGMYLPGPSLLQPVTILSIVVILILLIVCANVANLLLSRAATRQKEITVRLSLGATRGRLIRQLLTESVLLSAVGGIAGLLVAFWGRALIPGITSEKAPLDLRVFGFVAALSLLSGVAFGLAPALRATRANLAGDLKETSLNVSGRQSLLSKSLIVVQVAVSLVLLIAAGLFLQTLGNLKSVDLGFDARNILMFRLNPSLNGYDQNRIASLFQQVDGELRRIPGVQWVALTDRPQLKSGSSGDHFFVQGHETEHAADNLIKRTAVSPDFFATMGIPLVAGRWITDQDNASAPKVAVINEAAARKYFGGETPIGRRFGYFAEGSGMTEIVGVVRDARYNSLRDPVPPMYYMPLAQQRYGAVYFELKTARPPATIVTEVRNVVRGIDPNLPLMDVSTQMEQAQSLFSQERLFALAYSLFGALAVLLACIGLFGLMSYSVATRRNEMGIRMALGAARRDVIGLVLRESLTLILVGIVVGLMAALSVNRLIAALLFGLSSTDGKTMALAVTLMLVVSAIAGYLPARRAARIDPMIALRYD